MSPTLHIFFATAPSRGPLPLDNEWNPTDTGASVLEIHALELYTTKANEQVVERLMVEHPSRTRRANWSSIRRASSRA